MINEKIAKIFDEIGNMLEIMGSNTFRVRAYYRAAESIRNLNYDLEVLHKRKDILIEKIPGIGKDLHAKIIEIIESGSCKMHDKLTKEIGHELLELLSLRGIGPKKVKLFYDQLGVKNIKQLKSAAESGALAQLSGMGGKSQKSILKAINQKSIAKERIPYDKAIRIAKDYLDYMNKCKYIEKIEYAGSLRREKESIGDIDILATGKKPKLILQHFLNYEKINNVLSAGKTKSSIILHSNIQVDLRIVKVENFGAALMYFTGSKQFNIKIRTLALKKGYKVNEYGLFKGKNRIAGETEEEIFKILSMDYVSPKDRED